jgi:ATP-dependent DNA helicase RecG
MNKQEILDIISTGEGYTLEFKESLNHKEIGKEICAFANSDGGKIFLGVKDNGEIKKISKNNKLKSEIQTIARNIDPSLIISFEIIENIGIIYVPIGKDKPYSVNGSFYVRQGANTQKLNRNEIIEFLQNVNKISFEKQTSEFSVKYIDKNKLNHFLKKANINKNLPVSHILKNLNLLTNDTPNNACALLFSKKITKYFLNADISCVLYQGNSKAVMLDKKVFDADFISNFENSLLFILRNTKTKADIINLVRVETSEIPEEALREAILNAMIHRDYFTQGRILIEIYSDRVEILNPGKLLFDKKNFGKISVLRNPILADCILRTNLIEKIGSGIKRIKKLVPDVKFNIDTDWFSVIFRRNLYIDVGSKVGSNVGSKLTNNQKEILLLITKNPYITKKEIESNLDISKTAIDNNISKLKKEGILERVGSDKTGYWKIIK